MMARKKRCPECGSRKITQEGSDMKCRVCGHGWSSQSKRKRSRKEKKAWS